MRSLALTSHMSGAGDTHTHTSPNSNLVTFFLQKADKTGVFFFALRLVSSIKYICSCAVPLRNKKCTTPNSLCSLRVLPNAKRERVVQHLSHRTNERLIRVATTTPSRSHRARPFENRKGRAGASVSQPAETEAVMNLSLAYPSN